MSIPESMKQITEAAERLIAPADVQGSFILSEEQLKNQGRCIIFQRDAPDKTELVLGDEFEVKVENGKTFVVRKGTSFPETITECLKFLTIDEDNHIILKGRQLDTLIACRNVYWKLAGDWKPEYEESIVNTYYTIHTFNNKLFLAETSHRNAILSFPAEKMRDTFYENFKDLIEECKELL